VKRGRVKRVVAAAALVDNIDETAKGGKLSWGTLLWPSSEPPTPEGAVAAQRSFAAMRWWRSNRTSTAVLAGAA
jgi:hypothetical protein